MTKEISTPTFACWLETDITYLQTRHGAPQRAAHKHHKAHLEQRRLTQHLMLRTHVLGNRLKPVHFARFKPVTRRVRALLCANRIHIALRGRNPVKERLLRRRIAHVPAADKDGDLAGGRGHVELVPRKHLQRKDKDLSLLRRWEFKGPTTSARRYQHTLLRIFQTSCVPGSSGRGQFQHKYFAILRVGLNEADVGGRDFAAQTTFEVTLSQCLAREVDFQTSVLDAAVLQHAVESQHAVVRMVLHRKAHTVTTMRSKTNTPRKQLKTTTQTKGVKRTGNAP